MVEINLAQNGGFETDIAGWDVDPGTGTLTAEHATEGADAGSLGCLALTSDRPEGSDPSGPAGSISQTMHADVLAELRGRYLALAVRVACDTAGALYAWISEDGGETRTYGVGNADSRGHGRPTGENVVAEEYETLLAQAVLLTGDASEVVYGVEVRKPCSASLDNVTLVPAAAAVVAADTLGPGLLAALISGPSAAPTRASGRSKAELEQAEKAAKEKAEKELADKATGKPPASSKS